MSEGFMENNSTQQIVCQLILQVLDLSEDASALFTMHFFTNFSQICWRQPNYIILKIKLSYFVHLAEVFFLSIVFFVCKAFENL